MDGREDEADRTGRPPASPHRRPGEPSRAVEWDDHAAREERRYADGLGRLPEEADARQKQLVRMAMAAGGAGLARLMQGRRAEAVGWFTRSAQRYRESYEHAPAGSWGRLIGALKARILAGDEAGARADAAWVLAEQAGGSASPVGRYAAALAALVLDDDQQAGALAASLRNEPEEAFPRPVAEALAALARRDGPAYGRAARAVLASFESRDAHLEDIPVADTVLVLEALAQRRGLAAGLRSDLLPA